MGHHYGAETTERVVRWAKDLGIKQETMYAFSTENIGRTEEEKEYLFDLMKEKLNDICTNEDVHHDKMRLEVIGDMGLLTPDLQDAIEKAEQATKDYNRFILYLAVGYGGRREIVDTTREIAEKVKRGELGSGDITEDVIAEYLYLKTMNTLDRCAENTSELPLLDRFALANRSCPSGNDLDWQRPKEVSLIIRTGGDIRTSNFLPWQASGNECAAYFCAPFWPEFRKIDFLRAIRTYQVRESEKKRSTVLRAIGLLRECEKLELEEVIKISRKVIEITREDVMNVINELFKHENTRIPCEEDTE
jgi:tritrans,polycis-undecaprenyl-diphosphate synthase [geranylgeranyl-diphosphate specific]